MLIELNNIIPGKRLYPAFALAAEIDVRSQAITNIMQLGITTVSH